MTYSVDLRKRVVEFVQNGGCKAEASRRYKVSLWCVNDWCKLDDLTPQPQKGRKRKLDWSALSRHIQEYPDALLRERAQYFGVQINAIWYANRQMKLTRKKRCDPASPIGARECVMRSESFRAPRKNS
jgi:transposase